MGDWSEEFDAECVYLDTASLGLPPRRTTEALRAELDRWRLGQRHAPDYDEFVNRARWLFGGLVSVDPACIAIGPQASVYAGLVAWSLPADAVVLVPEGEFTSVTFPFLSRGLEVREVPLARLAESIDDSVTLVAFAAVQSANGAVADLDALADAAALHDVRTLVDLTQAAGWLPIDASRFDYTICSAYKWLLSPRGTCFLTVRPQELDSLTPNAPGWYAGDDPWTSIYGTPLRLAPDARRFDISPAWQAWVGTVASLELLTDIGVQTLHEHSVGLANDFRAQLGLPPGDSAIVSLATRPEVGEALARSGIRAAGRAGRLRLSFHVSTTDADVTTAAEVLGPYLLPG